MDGHSLTCTFCRKSEHQVQKLVAGPGVYICDACVEVAHRIVRSEAPPSAREPAWRRVVARIRTLWKAAGTRVGWRSVSSAVPAG